MKLTTAKFEKFYKIVKSWPIFPLLDKAYIFFPVLEREIKDDGGIELTINTQKESAARRLSHPGIILLPKKDDKDKTIQFGLAYADTTFAPTFDFIHFLDLYGKKLSKKELEEIKDLECLLVPKELVFEAFEY